MNQSKGFTLIEMAIVMALIGLLLGGMLMPIGAQIDQKNVEKTQKQLDEIRQALIGFASVNGYLPCPAISSANGAEDRNLAAGTCNKRQGFLPWSTLGVSNSDAWNNLFRYSVTPAFANSAPATKPTMTTNADITIQTRIGGALGNLTNITCSFPTLCVPVAVFSQGKNGYGAVNASGINQSGVPAANIDETTNANGPTNFVFGSPVPVGAGGGGEYDDMVAWISQTQLIERMVAAGALP